MRFGALVTMRLTVGGDSFGALAFEAMRSQRGWPPTTSLRQEARGEAGAARRLRPLLAIMATAPEVPALTFNFVAEPRGPA